LHKIAEVFSGIEIEPVDPVVVVPVDHSPSRVLKNAGFGDGYFRRRWKQLGSAAAKHLHADPRAADS